jgi:hypothetical protein
MGRPGLRQGNPFPPFLFLLAAEGFNVMMSQAVQLNLFEGNQVGRDGVKVSHLQYVDDTLIVCENREELEKAKIIYIGYPFKSSFPVHQRIQIYVKLY